METARPIPSSPHTRDREQIEEAIQSFIAAYNAGDVERLLQTYAEDLIKDRLGAAAETKAALAERLAASLRENTGFLEVWNSEIEISGDLAYVRGTFRVTLTPRSGGEAMVAHRRFVEIWRKRDGRWLVTRTMDNTGA